MGLADDRGWLFTGSVSLQSHPWLSDHAVRGSVLFPGTAFLELALHVGSQVGSAVVQELTFEAPLLLDEEGAVQLQLSVGELDEDGQRAVGIYSRPAGCASEGLLSEAQWMRHAGAVLVAGGATLHGRAQAQNEGAGLLGGESWPPEGSEALAVDDLYDRLAQQGFEYGPAFQGLSAVWRRGEDVFAEVSLPEAHQDEADAFGVHPALLDSAFHAGLSIAAGQPEADGHGAAVRLPFSFSGVELYAAGAACLRVCLSPRADNEISLIAADETGGIIASVDSLATRKLSAEGLGSARAHRDSLFSMSWVPIPVDPKPFTEDLVVLGIESIGRAEVSRVAGVLEGVEVYADLLSLGEAVDGGARVPEMVLVDLGTDVSLEGPGLLGVAHGAVSEVLGLMQQWLSDERFSNSRLVFLTRGAVAVTAGERLAGLMLAPVWGLVRSGQSENPDRFLLVDLDEQEASPRALPALLAAAAAGLDEPQLAIRDGNVSAPRLTRIGSDGALAVPAGVSQWRLDAGTGGRLEDLSLVPCPEVMEPLGVGQVRIGLRAGGLNFRDVMVTLGLVSAGGTTIGGEGTGVVLELGPGVDGLSVGDRVTGLLTGGFGSVAVTDHRVIVRVPDGWSYAQAASVPVVFLTAYYGLVDLAHLKAGERVLVHAATGGVGMVAVQLARHLGAEVFATASPGKWAGARGAGVG